MTWLYGNVEINDDPEPPDSVLGWYGQSTGEIMTGRIHRLEQGETKPLPEPAPLPDIIPSDQFVHYVECKCGLWVNVELVHCPACGRKTSASDDAKGQTK